MGILGFADGPMAIQGKITQISCFILHWMSLGFQRRKVRLVEGDGSCSQGKRQIREQVSKVLVLCSGSRLNHTPVSENGSHRGEETVGNTVGGKNPAGYRR